MRESDTLAFPTSNPRLCYEEAALRHAFSTLYYPAVLSPVSLQVCESSWAPHSAPKDACAPSPGLCTFTSAFTT